MNSGKIVLGVLAGLAVGISLGILFAPEKGTKTRKIITDKGDEYAKELTTKLDDICNMFLELFEHVNEEKDDLASLTKRKQNGA